MSCLKVLVYNVMLRPRRVFPDGQLQRVKHIAEYVLKHQKEIDVLVFCEIFDQRSHSYLEHFLQTSTPFRHCTARVGDEQQTEVGTVASKTTHQIVQNIGNTTTSVSTSVAKQRGFRGILSRVASYASFIPAILNGGVQIFSRYPLDKTETRVFCHRVELKGSDRLAKKGFAYACLSFPDPSFPRIHLVGTHLQAWEDRKAVDMRLKEVAHIRRFLQGLHIPTCEPVIVAGDLNVDTIHAPEDFEDMCRVLGAFNLDTREASVAPIPSVDPSINNMVGRDGAIRTSSSGKFERLDHCLALHSHSSGLNLSQCSSTVWTDWKSESLIPMGVAGLRHSPFRRLHSHHLSDHFPVLVRIELQGDEVALLKERTSDSNVQPDM